jgi:Zn finger protein HypA/HybF involved in hydrogenase expression
MADWIGSAILVGILILTCMYSYSVLQWLNSIRKCPDCGRIMQRVRYEDPEYQDKSAIFCECPFCQSTMFQPIHRGKKLTLYP